MDLWRCPTAAAVSSLHSRPIAATYSSRTWESTLLRNKASKREWGAAFCLKRECLRERWLCTLLASSTHRVQQQNIAEIITEVYATCGLCYVTKPKGRFRAPFKLYNMSLNMELHAKKTLVLVAYRIKRLAIQFGQRALLFLRMQITFYDEVVIVVMVEPTCWSQWPAVDCFCLEKTLLHTGVKCRSGRTCLTCTWVSCASIHAGQPQLDAAELCHNLCEFIITRPCLETIPKFCLKLSM